jgi:hypothetical protein
LAGASRRNRISLLAVLSSRSLFPESAWSAAVRESLSGIEIERQQTPIPRMTNDSFHRMRFLRRGKWYRFGLLRVISSQV